MKLSFCLSITNKVWPGADAQIAFKPSLVLEAVPAHYSHQHINVLVWHECWSILVFWL